MPHRRPPYPNVVIPPDRADGSSSFVHRALILTAWIGRWPSLVILSLLAALTALAAWPWKAMRGQMALAFACFLAGDWLLLTLLPQAARSWGPVTPSLLGLALVRCPIFLVPGVLGQSTGYWLTAIILNLALTAVAAYATWVEPFHIVTTRQTLTHAGLEVTSPIRALHISDIHFEGQSPREDRLIVHVGLHQPDLIFLTGDYLNLSSVYDPGAQEGARRLLGRLEARHGVYAVTGSPPVDVPSIVPGIFDGLPIRWLDDEAVPVEVNGTRLWVLGVRHTYDEPRDARALTRLVAETPTDGARILLYHTPDLMPVAASLGIDLYLCGHTHGGQIRLPLYGALATSSRWGKRYEHGRYREGRTTLYVSRGLGVEGLGAPRARFLAPPEIIAWHIGSEP